MIRFVFPDAREWSYIVESLAVLVDEASFKISPQGLQLRALDPSRVAMVDLSIPASAFEEFECDKEVDVGVNFEDLNKILKRGKADEKVLVEVSEGRLKIKLLGKAERTFYLPLLDIVSQELSSINLSFSVKAKMLSDTFRDSIKDVALVSDSVKFVAKDESLTLRAASDRGEVEVKFTLESGALIDCVIEEEAEATYSLSYLSDMLKKSVSLSDIVQIEFSSNRPIALTFNITSGGKLSYYLAPRVEA